MRLKEHLLHQDIKHYEQLKTIELKSAKRYKYLSIFTGASASVASIAALFSLLKDNQELSEFYIYTLCTIMFGILANNTHDQHKDQTKNAKRYHKKLLKAQQKLKTFNKTR
ncbi:MAG: hypothetical protein IIV74_03335 [Alphaproteobacteria bacterium]|nr:hypothetical protein [Alphaproteobacteria bacterium]